MNKNLDTAINHVEQAITEVKKLSEYKKSNSAVTCILALNMAKTRLYDLKESEAANNG